MARRFSADRAGSAGRDSDAVRLKVWTYLVDGAPEGAQTFRYDSRARKPKQSSPHRVLAGRWSVEEVSWSGHLLESPAVA